MRFSPGSIFGVLAAFAIGYGVARLWSTAESLDESEPKRADRASAGETSVFSPDASAPERLIALCEQPGSLARDHEIFATLQRMSAEDFARAVADFPSLVKRFEELQPGDAPDDHRGRD